MLSQACLQELHEQWLPNSDRLRSGSFNRSIGEGQSAVDPRQLYTNRADGLPGQPRRLASSVHRASVQRCGNRLA